jgi:hypothetical protein
MAGYGDQSLMTDLSQTFPAVPGSGICTLHFARRCA